MTESRSDSLSAASPPSAIDTPRPRGRVWAASRPRYWHTPCHFSSRQHPRDLNNVSSNSVIHQTNRSEQHRMSIPKVEFEHLRGKFHGKLFPSEFLLVDSYFALSISSISIICKQLRQAVSRSCDCCWVFPDLSIPIPRNQSDLPRIPSECMLILTGELPGNELLIWRNNWFPRSVWRIGGDTRHKGHITSSITAIEARYLTSTLTWDVVCASRLGRICLVLRCLTASTCFSFLWSGWETAKEAGMNFSAATCSSSTWWVGGWISAYIYTETERHVSFS